MASMRISSFAAPALLALLASACSDSRPASQGGSSSSTDTCVYCHGTVGRVANLPGTDPLLASAPPSPPSGKPASVTGAHQVHLNPPINGPLRAPIACSECHVVPGNLGHATNPPANPVEFGALARARGAAPTYQPLDLGCAAVYCHGNFDYNGVKGKAASVTWNGGIVGCGDCHGLPPTGHPPLSGTVNRGTCSQCHPNTVSPDGSINVTGGAHVNGKADIVFSCTSCHGTEGRTGFQQGTDPDLAAAPPVAPEGAPSYAVGAHQAHLNPPIVGSARGPLPCSECHVVPTDVTHATSPPPQKVVFGTLARAQNASPTWTPTTTGCSATYCHGNFSFNGVSGAVAVPLWTGGAITCTSCHGLPPTGHPPVPGAGTPATCSACHPSTVRADGTINHAGGAHLNGAADFVADCTSCHGTAGRQGILPGVDPLLASAPPAAPSGAPAYAVGAHQNHLNPPSTGSFRGPIACSECHVVPATADHAVNPPLLKVVFGTLATTGGAVPVWTSTTTGCAATYCHGNFALGAVRGANATPLWTEAGLSCVSCHGMPPVGHPTISGTVTPATCNQCHPSTVTPAGAIDLTSGAHINGRADVKFNCTSCHGTAGRTGNLAGTDPLLPVSPPVKTTGSPDSVVGAHQFHVNPPSAGGFRGPILCNECHVVPTDLAHATNPPANPVIFGTLARTGGVNPTWNGATLGCSATYCHGNFGFNGVTGAAAIPLWTDVWGTATSPCLNCHGLPPTGHPALAGTVTPATCNKCHPSTVNANGTINVATGSHLNGQANVAANCTSCHGDPTRPVTVQNQHLNSAPPVAPPGSPASVVGTHLLHLAADPALANVIRSAVDCDSCHVIPDNADHSIQFPPVVVFTPGTLGTTQGSVPVYNPTSLSCATTYCHGNFDFSGVRGNATATPAWNAAPSQSCTGCHAMPPTGHPALSGTVTPATCNGCHPDTVNANGTINLGGGKHIDGLAQVSGNPHTGDPLWVDRTHHGYQASSQGMAACTSCHTSFGGPSGTTAGSCNACHTTAGFATWQTNCTFCHGTPGRAATALNPQLAAAPPVDSAGNGDTSPRARGVGAHTKHVLSPTVSSAFACGNCHASALPTNVTHVDGQRAALPFGLIAITGNVQPVYNSSSTPPSCSTVYCHGAFGTVGQPSAEPVWTSTTPMTCTSCHKMPTTSTGEHSRHMGKGLNCLNCHNGIATGSGNPSTNATIVGPALHVNGTKNVVFGGTFGGSGVSGSFSNGNCTITCHGTETW